jgi:hypothetical protein
MAKRLLFICLVSLILVALFIPSCTPTTGTIEVKATLDGVAWTGAVTYTLTGPGATAPTVLNGASVDKTFTVDAGNWTCAYVSGGPGIFVNITTSATQEVVAGETETFTLNFVTPVDVDIEVHFKTWTHNGVPIPPQVTWVFVAPGDWIDVEYEEHVSGETGAHVTVHQTSWLSVHNIGWYGEEPQGAPVTLHVVNAPGAVKMSPPPADKSNQQATVEGVPVQPCANVVLPFCEPVKLDVEVDWELVVCNNYTKTINWIGFNPPGIQSLFVGADVLFESMDDFYTGVTFNLTAKACVEPGEGFEDTDPANDCTDWAPTLTVTYVLGP